MAMARRVEPEWLDVLPPADARAMRSRRDLRRVNALMSNAAIVRSGLGASAALRRVAEIGAGDGAFSLRVLRAMPRPEPGAELLLVDREPIRDGAVEAELASRGWRVRWERADAFDWLQSSGERDLDAVVANLFLHHFEDAPLARMLALLARRTRAFVACEPRRDAVALLGARLLGVVGCNDVTRHDAVVSVRAGFLGRELSALWPAAQPHRLEERPRGLFSHAFTARLP
ncbi:MAG TPA: class I SAM-dependent methyltransferase [Usitatibacter sp.]|nr:class I SAM-dependent methyltransferase [Usitatibacter sp.]